MSTDTNSPASAKTAPAQNASFDADAVAERIKQKIDTDLGDLKPNPPNKIQRVMRIAAYPIGLIAGLVFAHREARDGVEKYLDENGRFKLIHQAQASSKKTQGRERLRDHKKELQANINEKEDVIREFLGLPAEKPKNFWQRRYSVAIEAERTMELAAKDPARKSKMIFNGLFATTAAMGLLLTLSDNKNFLNFFGKGGNADKGNSLSRD